MEPIAKTLRERLRMKARVILVACHPYDSTDKKAGKNAFISGKSFRNTGEEQILAALPRSVFATLDG